MGTTCAYGRSQKIPTYVLLAKLQQELVKIMKEYKAAEQLKKEQNPYYVSEPRYTAVNF
jgi:hypothetical protein